MRVRTVRSAAASGADAIVVGLYAGRRRPPGAGPVLAAVGDWVESALDAAGFDGALGTTAVLPSAGADGPGTVVVVGLGDDLDLESLRQAAAAGRRAAAKAATVATTLHRVPIDGAVGAVVEGVALADYRFDVYRSGVDPRPETTLELVPGARGWREEADRALVVAESVCLARDLVNEPAAGKAPLAFAERVGGLAEEAGLAVEVWEGERLVEERMAGLLGVGGGSHRPPCLLRLEHGRPGSGPTLFLVGKGIVFDSGGLSIKTAALMEAMKSDMAGAAAVAAAAIAAARLELDLHVVALAALAENMPGGGAQRPGDVLRIRNGKTIEVLNTDAEGRLVLADALCLAAEARPALVVDVATLTGACKVALGPKIAGVFGNDEASVDRVGRAAEGAGERTWPLPLPKDYRTMIDSTVADMKNTVGGRYGGAIGAALLLAEFVDDVPWVHLDVAGPAFSDTAEHYVPKGGTGFGVRTLVELAGGLAAEG